MGKILWEDTISQELYVTGLYRGRTSPKILTNNIKLTRVKLPVYIPRKRKKGRT